MKFARYAQLYTESLKKSTLGLRQQINILILLKGLQTCLLNFTATYENHEYFCSIL